MFGVDRCGQPYGRCSQWEMAGGFGRHREPDTARGAGSVVSLIIRCTPSRRRVPRAVISLTMTMCLVLAACSGGAGQGASSKRATGSSSSAPVASGPPFAIAFPSGWGLTWSYNIFSPHFPLVMEGPVLLPLAVAKPPTLGHYVPELARSWQVSGSSIVVKLRSNASWQNGNPVRVTDVIDSLLLDGVSGGAAPIFSDITSLSAPSTHELRLQLRAGVPAALVEQAVLTTTPVPASVYGGLITKGLQQELLQYYALAATNPAAAGKTAAGAAVAAAFKKLEAFNPKSLLGDGPFRLAAMTNASARLPKWAGFWGARKIHPPSLELINASSTSAIFPMMLSGKSDFTNDASIVFLLHRWMRTPHAHYVTPPAYAGISLYFNNRHYPLSLVGVRQALAYVINRQVLSRAGVAGNSYSGMRPVARPDGILHSMQTTYLTPTQLASLHRYGYDPAKATKLLEALHFTKGPRGWLLPNGQPFTLTVNAPSQLQLILIEMKNVASQLSAFGIHTAVQSVPVPGYFTYLHQGRFDLAWGWSLGASLDPLAEVASVLGPQGYDFSTAGAYANDAGIGFGPVETVPGIGKINVPLTIQKEAASVAPGAKMRQLTWDWARLVNQQLPFLIYSNKYAPHGYSSRHYIDWPSPSSPLWRLTGLTNTEGLIVMMQSGYIRPRG